MVLSTSDLEAYGVSPEKSKEFLDKINAEMRASVPQQSATQGLSAEAEQRLRAEFEEKMVVKEAAANKRYRRLQATYAVDKILMRSNLRDVDMARKCLDWTRIKVSDDGVASGVTEQVDEWKSSKQWFFDQPENDSGESVVPKQAQSGSVKKPASQKGGQWLQPAEPPQSVPKHQETPAGRPFTGGEALRFLAQQGKV